MSNVRLIARMDIKGPNLIKGIQLEGLRVIGDPQEYATRYYKDGVDELLYVDVVASLYGRNNLEDVVRWVTQNVFVPVTVAGGIRTVADVDRMLHAGADKVAVNTAAIKRPELIKDISRRFGSQCMVVSIEAKQVGADKWEAYYDNGREKTGMDAVEWAVRAVSLGAGEILLTSVDREGTRQGFDLNLVKAVSSVVPTPVIASGGMGSTDHLVEVVQSGLADAVAMADILHYGRLSIPEIRNAGLRAGIHVRKP